MGKERPYLSSQTEAELASKTLTGTFADSYFDIDLRSPYAGGDNSDFFNTLTLLFTYQLFAAETSNVLEIQIAEGMSFTDLYKTTALTTSSGDVTAAEATYKFTGANSTDPYKESIQIDTSCPCIRVYVRETGQSSSNFGTVAIKSFVSKR